MTDKYLTHAQIEEMNMTVDEEGNVYATSRNIPIDEQYPLVAFGLRVAPPIEFLQLLAAAPILYQCVSRQNELFVMLLRDLDRLPNRDASHIQAMREMLEAMQKFASMAQSCAIDGFGPKEADAPVETPNRQTN